MADVQRTSSTGLAEHSRPIRWKYSLLPLLLIVSLHGSALAQRPMGVDVSYWQGYISQDGWNAVRASGRTFAIVRAVHYSAPGESNAHGSPDPYFVGNMTRARAAGIAAGAYSFVRNSIRDPITEADFFLTYAAPYISPGYLRPVLDLEDGTAVVGAIDLTSWAVAWCNRVEQQTGVRPMIYTSSNYARNHLSSSITAYPLWVANWTYPANPQTDDPPSNVDGIWPTWTFWQHSNQGNGTDVPVPGINTRVGLNVFNGTEAQLQNYVIPSPSLPPVISNVNAGNITDIGATISWTTDTPASTQVQYGLTPAYGSATPLNATLVTNHSAVLSGLSSSTLYHYRVISINPYGTTYSQNATFTTSGVPGITNVQAVDIGAGRATITWSTSAPSTSQVLYGFTSNYGSYTGVNPTLVTSHSVLLNGLVPDTQYHFQALSTNAYGAAQSADLTFTTGGLPVIIAVGASNVSATSATIDWYTNVLSSSQVEYGLTPAYGSWSDFDFSEVNVHSIQLTGLSPNTRYHYRVHSINAAGIVYSGNYTFKTAMAPDPQSIIIETRNGGQNVGWYSEQGVFGDSTATSSAAGCTSGVGSRYGSTYRSAAGLKIARFTPVLNATSQWLVSVTWSSGANRRSPILYRVVHAGGTTEVDIDQTGAPSQWVDLGVFTMASNSGHRIEMSNEHIDESGSMYASAVRLIKVKDCGVVYRDADGDGYGNPLESLSDCDATPGYVSDDTDCHDGNAGIHPNHSELCNGMDDNCNGTVDEGFTALAITLQPENAVAQAGETASFDVVASGSGLSYQWQVDAGEGFAAVTTGSGADTATYTTATLSSADDGNVYRCIVTGDCGEVVSNLAVLSVNQATNPPLVTEAVSRRTHGGAGDFDVDVLSAGAVESRLGGPRQLVVTFSTAIEAVDVVAGNNVIVSSGSVTALLINGDRLTVSLSDVVDGARVTMSFPGIVSAGGGAPSTSSLCFGSLTGDADSDGECNVFDMLPIRNGINRPTEPENCHLDLNTDGTVTILDVIAVRNNLNHTLSGSCP